MPVYSVFQFNSYVKNIFQMEELLRDINIKGEVCDLSQSGDKVFFTLKDDRAQISCFYFDIPLNAYIPSDGDNVVVQGSPNFYVKGGKLSFNVKTIEPQGMGNLYKEFLMLKKRLQDEGLFDRKIPLPKIINKIGVVTSPGGAVIRDIINIVRRRSPMTDIVIYPVKVQGIGAEKEIAEGIKCLDAQADIDAIVLARGGGAAEDLNAFNTEAAARAVADCKKYIVSAVGHETDFTLCDFAADFRASTPSVAAEVLTKDNAERIRQLSQSASRLNTLAVSLYKNKKAFFSYGLLTLENRAHELTRRAYSALIRAYSALNMEMFVSEREAWVKNAQNALENLSPLKLLERGFARVTLNGKNVTGANELNIDDNIKIYFADGKVKAAVKEKESL